MRRIGIFGGTFDPPHYGHLGIVEAVGRSGLVDEIWLMVSPENPFKSSKKISNEADRLEMTRRAAAHLNLPPEVKVRVSDFEAHLPRPTYTVTTLRALKQKYPDCSFRLIVGGDNLEAFARWRDPEEILRDYGLIVYPRQSDSGATMSQIPAGCVVIENVPLFPYSSTQVRAAVAGNQQKVVSEMIPSEVAEFIKDRKLYD